MPKEYIDREALMNAIPKPWAKDEKISQWGAVMDCIVIATSIPAADVAPVVHGEWVKSLKQYSYYQYRCSVCGFDNYSHKTRNGVIKLMKYCPNCGAKMDGGT